MKSLNRLSASLPAVTGQAHPTTLTITLNPGERPKYEFFPKEFVISSGDLISVELKANNNDLSELYIVGFCCTDPGKGVVEIAQTRIRLIDGTYGDVLAPDQPLAEGTEWVTFKLNLEKRQMVLIGLIVAIKRLGESSYTRYLCDPQVGNGPP